MTELQYKWDGAGPTESHAYLVTPILSFIPQKENLRIADLGCGNGYLAGLLADRGHRVTALDSSEEGIRLAKLGHPNVSFLCGSIYEDLNQFMGSGYDIVIASEVIEHLYDPRAFLHAAHLLLKKGGTLILTTPYHGYLKNLVLAVSGKMDKHFTADWDCGHIKFFSVKTLTAMVREFGFKNIQFDFAGRLPFLWKSMILRAEK